MGAPSAGSYCVGSVKGPLSPKVTLTPAGNAKL